MDWALNRQLMSDAAADTMFRMQRLENRNKTRTCSTVCSGRREYWRHLLWAANGQKLFLKNTA